MHLPKNLVNHDYLYVDTDFTYLNSYAFESEINKPKSLEISLTLKISTFKDLPQNLWYAASNLSEAITSAGIPVSKH